MSILQRLFGGSKKEDPNVTTSQAIERLSSVEDILNKKQEHLESQVEAEKKNALDCSKKGNKRGALMAMKKKKKFEKMLLQIDGTLTTIESQREALQNATSNMEVFRVMRQAATALKKSNEGVDADSVNELKDDLDEQLTLADEVANAMAAPGLNASSEYTDADLMKELEDLAEEDDRDQMIRIGPLPDVPTSTPTTTQKVKQKDNPERELEAWMNS